MKSTDRKILILVASLALLLAGCGGGGSSTTAPVDPGPAPAETAIMEAETALMNAEDALEMLDASATNEQMRAAYQAVERAANNLVMVLKANGGSPAAVEAATTTRQTAMHMADNLAQKIEDDAVAADAAMTALAAKLYAAMKPEVVDGATIPFGNNGTDTSFSTGVLFVQNANTAYADFGSGVGNTGPQLKEDKSAMVPPLHGWTGSRHTATVAAGATRILEGNTEPSTISTGTYTAHMYSDVGEPTQGPKFNSGQSGIGFTLIENRITVSGPSTINGVSVTYQNNIPVRIASPQFDHTAGDKTFKLPDPNPQGETIINIPGSYYGVEGTYDCVLVGTGACTVTKASGEGYILGGENSWIFRPDNPEDRVTSLPDTVYPVYGWWQHETTDGATYVSAFTSYRGTKEAVSLTTLVSGGPADPLFGTATYKGGAAGIYTISADADNDAGHFTADAELTATFNGDGTFAHKITGTIDNFMGSDGMSRDWSVELKQLSIGDNGAFTTYSSSYGTTTTWSMGGTAAGDSGAWEGELFKQNDGYVPTVGTGVFYSEYENIGRMTGAFGVNLEE